MILRFPKSLAVASVVLALMSSVARATLVINLRFADGSTTHTLTAADVGHDVEIDVWATITGQNAPSAHNFFGLDYVYYSVASSLPSGPGMKVDGTIDGAANALVAPFGANGSQVGVTQDINGDGVADVGSVTVLTDVDKPRSAGGIFNDNPAAVKNALPMGYEFEVEKIFFHVNSLTSAETDFTGLPSPPDVSGPYVPANWWQDAPSTDVLQDTPLSAPILAGATVRLVSVPEPGGVGILLGVCGAMTRRKRRIQCVAA